MEYYQLLAGLALSGARQDDGSGPPPVPSGHEADRLATRTAAHRGTAGAVSTRGRRLWRRGRGVSPAAVT